ncbi:hypothetical protein [Pseudonocardia acidicola]|uniref:Small secreted domain DUF320 n=1 Tax=Pseudonocardia acidicola TaxID=2724939 RepID=A0ABX1S985_9PSEU|nr:hypothetical protein [Pseudonocardia acidicola]NMH98123.1 hypothetical protein [Pseudonocardia acidicola]
MRISRSALAVAAVSAGLTAMLGTGAATVAQASVPAATGSPTVGLTHVPGQQVTAQVPGIPQNNGGDQDADNNGGPDDGDGPI